MSGVPWSPGTPKDPACGCLFTREVLSCYAYIDVCVPSLEAVQQRTHELRACGLGSKLAVTSVRYGNQTAVETLLGLPELEGNACLFNITRLLCWGPLLTQ